MYTDKTAIQNYLLKNIDATFDSQLTAWITAMTEYADDLAGYPLYRSALTSRLYDGNGQSGLIISPVIGITAVTVDSVTVTPVAYPLNSDPKTWLLLRNNAFTNGYANVSVTGQHCLYATLPEKIKWAVTVLVAGIVNQSNNQSEGVQSEKIGEYQVTYRDEKERGDYARALDVLKAQRRIAF